MKYVDSNCVHSISLPIQPWTTCCRGGTWVPVQLMRLAGVPCSIPRGQTVIQDWSCQDRYPCNYVQPGVVEGFWMVGCWKTIFNPKVDCPKWLVKACPSLVQLHNEKHGFCRCWRAMGAETSTEIVHFDVNLLPEMTVDNGNPWSAMLINVTVQCVGPKQLLATACSGLLENFGCRSKMIQVTRITCPKNFWNQTLVYYSSYLESTWNQPIPEDFRGAPHLEWPYLRLLVVTTLMSGAFWGLILGLMGKHQAIWASVCLVKGRIGWHEKKTLVNGIRWIHFCILWLERCGVIAKMGGIHITSHREKVEDIGDFPLVDI